DTVKSLRVIQACLDSQGDGSNEESEDTSSSLSEICDYIGRIILPVVPTSNDDDSDDGIFQSRQQKLPVLNFMLIYILDSASAAQTHFLFKGELGLNILRTLSNRNPFTLTSSALLSMVAYTNPQDPWTSDASADIARSLLQSQFSQEATGKPVSKAEFITDTLLTLHLRPLFSKSRPATINASGRKAAFVEEMTSTMLEDRANKLWKYAHVYAVTVFEWAVTNAAVTTTTASKQTTTTGDNVAVPLLAKTWHLFTPVLLTLLDESETALKIRTLAIFGAFWSGCPPGLMEQVGLASVFEDAAFPAVHFLPNITPEDESRRILSAAYPALFQLAGITASSQSEEESTGTTVLTTAQRKLLDRIIREGILAGYFHAKNHIQLTAVFCEKLSYAVNGMGILSVKYLKYAMLTRGSPFHVQDIFPMISEIMTNPFGTKHTPSLLAAIQLLQAVLRCCWPRISGYQNEIIRMLTVCWLNIADEDDWATSDNTAPTKEDLEAQLTKTAAMLSSIIRNNSQDDQDRDQPSIVLDDLVSPLIKKEPLLAPLFAGQ
ncbi:hypothetical protein PG996_010535, partial [Apiospora saccharicola]